MAQSHFTNLLIVVVVAFGAPLVLGLAPRLRLPAVVLEIDVHRLRGRTLRITALGYLVSLVIGVGAGVAFHAGGLVRSPLFIAIVLASSLGVSVPVLKPTAAGLIAAGLLSVIVFPVTGLSLLRRSAPAETKPASTKPSPASAILSTDDRVLCRTPQTTVVATA